MRSEAVGTGGNTYIGVSEAGLDLYFVSFEEANGLMADSTARHMISVMILTSYVALITCSPAAFWNLDIKGLLKLSTKVKHRVRY